MISFPPEFYGLVNALWATYQYAILIWMALTFAGVVVIGLGIVIYNTLHGINLA
jgi:hypothetical protein